MNDFDIRNGIKITVEDSGRVFHSYNNWRLYVANNDPIGEPKQYTNYIEIPGRDGKVDLSEALSRKPIFTSREIKIYLAGFRDTTEWDAVISSFRNHIMGRVCRITFDTDPEYYWKGRVGIIDFKPVKEFGKFLLEMPEADPYKYSVLSSDEPWLWNPFNFETDVITYTPAQQITGSGSMIIHAGHMLTCPSFVVADIESADFKMVHNGREYTLVQGTNVFPSIMVNGDNGEQFDFTGTAKVQIVYRGGSL